MTDYIGKTYQPFALGNQFKALGYTVKGYHAWTYTYYNRHLSHPSLGYEWIGYNRNGVSGYSGLENFKDISGQGMSFPWVPSDYDTARITVNDFINEEPFHVYYMTISGHTNYNWSGNAMCKKHRAEINSYCQQYGLSYSEEVKAYLACQLEVEMMLTELVERLEAAGKLDNTVFVMGTDHYPYGLSDSSLAELYGIPLEGLHSNFELYRNTLIIWNSAMKEPIYIDTPCSAIDILPTVSNLFGLPFDSRLMAGTDVLSGTDPIVIVNFDKGAGSWNWLTRYGSYKTVGKVFTTNEGFSASQAEINAYVKQINNLISAKRVATFNVLEYDYYSFVFGKK
jgi:phosphoglycerol transferase MdoB-like AlkP superfamily enzyme